MRTRHVLWFILAIVLFMASIAPVFAQEELGDRHGFPVFNDERYCGEEDWFSYVVPSPDGSKLAVLHWDDDYWKDTERPYQGTMVNAGNPYAILVWNLVTGEIREVANDSVHWTQPVWVDENHVIFEQWSVRRTYLSDRWMQAWFGSDKLYESHDYISMVDIDTGETEIVTEGFGRVAVYNGIMAFRRRSETRAYQLDIWLRDLATGAEWRYADRGLGYESMTSSSLTVAHEISAYNLSFSPSGRLLGEIPSFSRNVQTIYDVTDFDNVIELLPLDSGFNTVGSVSEFQGAWKGDHDSGIGGVVYALVDYWDDNASIHSNDDFYRDVQSSLL
ncbi:hypothetical protein C4564_03675, partial [Candidatus Microgenomates bacterium]